MQIVQPAEFTPSTPPPEILAVLHEFFDRYRAEEFQKEIWNLMIAYCSQRDDEIPTAISRSNTAFFCANINTLLNQLHKVWIVGCTDSSTRHPE